MLACLYCGTTKKLFLKTGKLGCPHCYTNFLTSTEVYRYSNLSKLAFEKIAFHLQSSSNWRKALDFLLESGFSIRFRYARNLKNFTFKVREEFLDDFFEASYKVFGKYFSLEHHKWKYFNDWFYLDLFDEDHFRIYAYPRSTKEVLEFFHVMRQLDSLNQFAFHEKYKFLTACPTNSYLGNKVSIFIDLESSFLTKIIDPNWISLDKRTIDLQKKQRLIFFLKNFTFKDLKKFFQFWENFSKSKTSSYK